MELPFLSGAFLGALALGAGAQEVATRMSLTLDGARAVIAAAEAYARSQNAPGSAIAVVDAGGNLIALERLDGTFAAGANVSIGKARTAVLFQKPTSFFEQLINSSGKGRTSMTVLEGFTPLQGGIPIVVVGQVIGGIGVSGAASAQQDEEVAQAGARAAESFGSGGSAMTTGAVSYFQKEAVAAAFQKGAPLIETPRFKIHASRREGPGQAEIHQRDTDIIYVVEGTATLVAGGSVVDPQTTATDEVRGSAIEGGETRRLVKGDVLVVPKGTPHWFKEVQAPFTYYVVKTNG
jgi:glc operon protein GlcG